MKLHTRHRGSGRRAWGLLEARRVAVGLFTLTLAVAMSEHARAQKADYGDAPDPGYPSLRASGGPFHVDTTQEWIGPPTATGSTTTTENDSLQPDRDQDDGRGGFFVKGAELYFTIGVGYDRTRSAAGDKRYLNVLMDLDDNGRWDGGAEWIVDNWLIDFSTMKANHVILVHTLPRSMLGAVLRGVWVRATLSTTTVADGRGAWGRFARGETEDFRAAFVPPPPKLKGIQTVLPVTIVYARPSSAHGTRHGSDGLDPDAWIRVRTPFGPPGPPGWSWRVTVTRTFEANRQRTYQGRIIGTVPALALPGRLGASAISPAQVAPPPIPLLLVRGNFVGVPGGKRGDSHFSIKVTASWDPQGTYVQVGTRVTGINREHEGHEGVVFTEQPPTAPGIRTYGWGCTPIRGSRVVPRLSSSGSPRVGGVFSLNLSRAAPLSPTILGAGMGAQPVDLRMVGVPGCVWFVGMQFVAVPLVTSGSGVSSLRVQVPKDKSLVGGSAHVQFLVFPGQPSSWALSRPAGLTIGI